jgi:hypothetical protein
MGSLGKLKKALNYGFKRFFYGINRAGITLGITFKDQNQIPTFRNEKIFILHSIMHGHARR